MPVASGRQRLIAWKRLVAHWGPGRHRTPPRDRRTRITLDVPAVPIEPGSDVFSPEFELAREVSDDVAEERVSRRQLDLATREVVQDRLGEPPRPGAFVAPLEVGVEVPIVVEHEVRSPVATHDPDDDGATMAMLRLRATKPDIGATTAQLLSSISTNTAVRPLRLVTLCSVPARPR